MYFLGNIILPIFAIAVSFLGQASQVAEKCLQGCQSKALLSPDNIDCSVDKISPCSCAWTPLRDINFCCLVNNCLLSPEDAIYQWTVDCAKIGVPVPAFSIEIPCSETGKGSSPTLYSIPSRTVKYYRVDSTIGYAVTTSITDFAVPLPSIPQVIEPNRSILVSNSRGSSTFNSEPSKTISTPSPSSATTAVPATAPQTSPGSPQKTTVGDSPVTDEKKKMGIKLGLSIPVALLLALAAIFFWIRRLKSKKRIAAAEIRDREDKQKGSGMRKERLSDIPEEGGYNSNKENASSLSELHSDPIPPYSTELPGTPAPQLAELPG